MKRYRSRGTFVAEQFDGETAPSLLIGDNGTLVGDAGWETELIDPHGLRDRSNIIFRLWVKSPTLGPLLVSPGDWVTKSDMGYFDIKSDESFTRYYEEVPDAPEPV